MKFLSHLSLARAGLALALLASPCAAQTQFWSQEPNETKDTATPAFAMQDGDSLLAANCGQVNPNFFRVRTAPAVPAIYEHRLTKSVTGYGYFNRIDIFGRDSYPDQVLPNSLARLSTSDDAGAAQPFVSWYGFGKSEEMYVNLVDQGSCRSQSRVDLTTAVVTPVVLDPIALPNNEPRFLNVTARDTTSQTSVEVHVFDAEFNAIPESWSDDAGFGNTSALSRVFVPGRYYFALSETGMASHLPASALMNEGDSFAEVLDFAGAVVGGGGTTGFDIELSISGGQGNNRFVTVTRSSPFEVLWVAVDVGTGQSTASFCPGDGTAMACPCGSDAPLGSGMGCVNSTGRGATIVHSLTNGLGRMTLEDLPANSASVLFASLSTQSPSAAIGGIACLGSGAFRFPPIAANAAGTAVFDFTTLNTPASLRGVSVFVQAGYRDSLAPPCNVNLTSGVTFPML